VLLKRAAFFFAVLCAAVWTSCGSSSGNNTTVSKIKDRALFDNAENGLVEILNIDTKPVSVFQSAVASLTMPEQMLISPDRKFVLIYDDAAFNLSFFDTVQETVTATMPLNYHADSIVMSADGKHAYAAVPNIPQQSTPPGAVLSFDLTTGSSGALIPVPGARRLAISGDGKTLLVFSDGSNSVNYVNLTGTTFTAVPVAGFNLPYAAYFSSDNVTAYVLNCGTECGSNIAPSVQPLAITSTTQTPGAPLTVPGATVGWLNGTTLYVAGNDLTKAAGQQGTLSTVNVSNMTVTAATAISDGLHLKIASFDSKLWIGSWNCTTTNCLSIVDPSSNTATIAAAPGNVTAFTPAPVKDWMYVVQGGELYQYDPKTLTSTIPYDIVGQGWDIKLLDQ
jgi:hypothetical protein